MNDMGPDVGEYEGSIPPFLLGTLMEAERINAIARRLADIETRAAELRRYL